MKSREWRELCDLVNAVRQAEESRLAGWVRRRADVEAALARVEEAADLPARNDDAYQRAGGDLRWQAWCDARKTELHADLAHVRFRQAAQIEATRRATARALATEAVWRDASRRETQLEERRREREG